MGIWKQLFGIEDVPQPVKHLSQKPPVRSPPPEKNISEPVLSEPVRSIIQTLKDGEWSFVAKGWQGDILYFTHEWYGNILTIYYYGRNSSIKTHCTAEWMTQDEKEAVGDVCWQIYPMPCTMGERTISCKAT